MNKDQKTGQIEKIKYIRKKKLEVVTQKEKKAPTELMDNVNINTYLAWSEGFKKVLMRTEKIITFDKNKVKDACQAIIGYAKQHHQKYVDVQLKM